MNWRVTHQRQNQTSDDPTSEFFDNPPTSELVTEVPAKTRERAIEKAEEFWAGDAYWDASYVTLEAVDLEL